MYVCMYVRFCLCLYVWFLYLFATSCTQEANIKRVNPFLYVYDYWAVQRPAYRDAADSSEDSDMLGVSLVISNPDQELLQLNDV